MRKIIVDSMFLMTRVAVLDDKNLEKILIVDDENTHLEGNIYLSRVTNIVKGLNSAFCDIGQSKKGYMHVKDAASWEAIDNRVKKHNITDYVKNGSEIFIQVIKEDVDYKGAKVTTRLSIPGKYSVIIPNSNKKNVSRKIKDKTEVKRLLRIFEEMTPENCGFTIRTDAVGKSEEVLKSDFQRLIKYVESIESKRVLTKAPSLVYRAPNSLEKLIMDYGNSDIEAIIFNDKVLYEDVLIFLSEYGLNDIRKKVKLEENNVNIFIDYNIEGVLNNLQKKKVNIDGGGFIVIDETEAFTIIDVNSGTFVGDYNQEKTNLEINKRATKVIARELKLRNIGGIILIDFIDMKSEENRKKVIDVMEDSVISDKLNSYVVGFTKLGLLEMTRKKSGRTISEIMHVKCDSCFEGITQNRKVIVNQLLKDAYYRT
jgi:ribonuclease G